MDLVLLAFSLILLLAGIAGCLFPVIPGPPLSFMALLLISFTGYAGFTVNFLVITGLAAVAVTVIDLFVPVWATRRFGGTRYGMWGAGIGIIAGIFFLPPIGLLLGPLAGAVTGELVGGAEGRRAIKAGLGSFLGFILGVGMKLAVSVTFTVYFVRAVFSSS